MYTYLGDGKARKAYLVNGHGGRRPPSPTREGAVPTDVSRVGRRSDVGDVHPGLSGPYVAAAIEAPAAAINLPGTRQIHLSRYISSSLEFGLCTCRFVFQSTIIVRAGRVSFPVTFHGMAKHEQRCSRPYVP
jgi:hypothetical protein